MSFRTYFLALDAETRKAYADSAGSTVGYLTQVAYGNKQLELGFADVLVAVAGGKLELDDLPLTERAQAQRAIRTNPPPAPKAEPAKAA